MAIRCFEESTEGVRIFTERGEFMLSDLVGGELYSDEVATLEEYGHSVRPGYAPKQQAEA